MGTVKQLPRNERFFPKFVFVTVTLLVCAVIAGFMVWFSFSGNFGNPKSVANLSGAFGGSYGVSNLTQKRDHAASGLDSTTLTFDLKELPSAPLPYSLSYVGSAIGRIPDPGIVNIVAKGITTENNKINVNYYAGTPQDYSGKAFSEITDVTNELVSAGAKDITVTSKPSADGGRKTDIAVSTKGLNLQQGATYQQMWSKVIGSVTKYGTDKTNNSFTVSLTNKQDNGISVTVDTVIFDQASLDRSTKLDTAVWDTLTAYSSAPSFVALKPQEVVYSLSPKATTSKFSLVFPGKQGDAGATNGVVTAFQAAVNNTETVSLINSYITSLKYAETPDEFYTNYSSNIVW